MRIINLVKGWLHSWLRKISNDYMWIIWSRLTILGTAKHQIIEYVKGKFRLKREDWRDWLKAISNAGANAFRIMPYAFWKYESGDPDLPMQKRFQPYYFDPVKRKWDLARFNDYYFPILRTMLEDAKAARMVCWFSLFDNCQNHNKFPTPWKNNLQGIKRFYQDWEYTKFWIDKVLQEFKCLPVVYELGNEISADGVSMEVAKEWGIRVIHYLLENGIAPENICLGATFPDIKYTPEDTKKPFKAKYRNLSAELKKSYVFRPDNKYGGEHAKKAVFRPAHRCLDQKTEDDKKFPKTGIMLRGVLHWFGGKPKGSDPSLVYSDDGTRYGGPSCDQDLQNNKIRPGIEKWNNGLDLIFSYNPRRGKVAIEHLPSKKATLDCQVEILNFISERYKKKYGKFPRNKRNPINFPPLPIDPPPEPDPPEKSDKGKALLILGAVLAAALVITLILF